MGQTFHFRKGSGLDIQDGNAGAVFGDGGPQFSQGMYLVHRVDRT